MILTTHTNDTHIM